MNVMNNKRIKKLVLATASALLLCCSSDRYGAKVTIQNVGITPLHSVVVRVTGNSYSVGELSVSETRTIKTYPTGESHIVIEHIDSNGEKKELAVNCYFEPGCRSTINVKVTVDSATKVE